MLGAGANQALKVDAAATINYNAATKTAYINVNTPMFTSQCAEKRNGNAARTPITREPRATPPKVTRLKWPLAL